jgi:hypothetical protein
MLAWMLALVNEHGMLAMALLVVLLWAMIYFAVEWLT